MNSGGYDGNAGLFPPINILRENDMYGTHVLKVFLLHNGIGSSLVCVSGKECHLIMTRMYMHVFYICKGHGSKLISMLTLQTINRFFST